MGRSNNTFDWITVILLILLTMFGLFLLGSTDTGLFYQQFTFVIIGLALLIVFSRIRMDILEWFAPFGYVLMTGLLLISYLGPSIRGATRWIIVGGVQLQPSELAKPLLMVFMAWMMSKFSPRRLRNLPVLLISFAVPFFLVFRQPDLGSAIIYGAIFIIMLLAAGLDLRFFILALCLVGVMIPYAGGHLAPYQKNRIMTFLNPGLDPKGAGYNALQSTIAIGSGNLIGRGLGFGTQSHLRFLPEFHTDFIFASLVEELGFLGGTLLLVIYGMLLARILFGSWKLREYNFAFIYSYGLFAMVLSQVFINAGMNMGILPITGITLPFVSYGGSSLISLFGAFGLLEAISKGRSSNRSIVIT